MHTVTQAHRHTGTQAHRHRGTQPDMRTGTQADKHAQAQHATSCAVNAVALAHIPKRKTRKPATAHNRPQTITTDPMVKGARWHQPMGTHQATTNRNNQQTGATSQAHNQPNNQPTIQPTNQPTNQTTNKQKQTQTQTQTPYLQCKGKTAKPQCAQSPKGP